MTVRRLIAAMAVFGAIGVAGLVAVGWWGMATAGRVTARLTAAEARAEIVATLIGDAHAYSEQVAAVLVFGKTQTDELGRARVEMERSLSRLNQVTQQQITALGELEAVRTELPEVDATRRMIELYHGIDLSAARALVQLRNGNLAQAAQLYQTEVQFRLSNELQPLFDASLSGERAEATADFDALESQRRASLAASIAIGVVLVVGLAGIAVLGRRAARRERSAADAELEARQRQWEAAADGLKDIDERRSQLLADVSHQLRTPLTILRGEADVALRGGGQAAALRQALERVQEQAVELGQLLEDLIVSARSDAESQAHEPALVPLGAVVAAAVQEGQALAELREATIVAVPGDGSLRVNADPRRLRQALVIGLDNAVKHTPPGGRIDVETERRGATAVIRILDRGPGIDPAEQPRVFERFFRGRAEAELANQGLGIGLAIAKAVVERHGGTIALGNRPDGGAVLEITLPVAEN